MSSNNETDAEYDAASTAEHIDPGDADGYGVRLDTLVEARITAEFNAYLLRQAAVNIDSVIDDPLVYPLLGGLSEHQSALFKVADRYDSLENELSARLASMREEAQP